MKLFFVRHAESVANLNAVLASRLDYPLSDLGNRQAELLADVFYRHFTTDAILSSPLRRARQTASYFSELSGIKIITVPELTEQHLGKFSGLSYDEVEKMGDYCLDRTKRWDWIPAGGGESYKMISERVMLFFRYVETLPYSSVLIVTHAVTMRLIHAVLTNSLPVYPETIAKNGEIWKIDFTEIGKQHTIEVLDYTGSLATDHSE